MIVSLDPGFGNTKVCAGGIVQVIQTAVSRPKTIGQAGTGLKMATELRYVEFDNQKFAVGPGAWHWGEPLTSLDYGALSSPERKALFYAALGAALPAGEYDIDLLVIGLPVALLQDERQAQAVFDGLRAYKGPQEFCLYDKTPHRIDVKQIKVLAQPVGAYADWLIGEDLRIRKGGKGSEAAVMDIGMNTLDLYVLRDGAVEPRFLSGAKVGVRRLLDVIDGDGRDVEEVDSDLRAGSLKASQTELTAWLGDVLAVVERSWPNLRRFATVIPAGGGAVLMGELLRQALAVRGAAVAWPTDPISTNVRGLWKWYQRGK